MRRFLILALSAAGAAPLAFAQGAAAAGAGWEQFLIFIPMIAIFYFLIIRPQNKRRKEHQAMIDDVKKGDRVVTSGGLIGKVIKVAADELTVEVDDKGTRVKVIRGMLMDVRGKGAPVAANDSSKS